LIEKISFQYPWWFLFICALVGITYAVLLYRKETRFSEGPKWLQPIMSICRVIAVTSICVLLMTPIIKSLQEEKKDPIVVILEDVSKSVATGTNKQQLITFEKELNSLKSNVSKKYEVKSLYFGEDVSTQKDSLKTNSTNISSGLEYVYENFIDQNIGSVILISDGIYNEGSNPAYANLKFGAPVHTIALGDTTERKDLLIKNVLHNKIAYLGDKFSIKIDVAATNSAGSGSRLKVEEVNGNTRKVIQEIPFNVDSKNYFKSFDLMLDANQIGIVKYTVTVAGIAGEVSFSNNKKDIYVEVLDGRQNVLILANAPHPDIAAITSSLSTNKNYKVTTAFISEAKTSIAEYSLVILHNLPSDQNDISAELSVAKNKNIPLLYIAGTQVNQAKFNLVQDVMKIKGNSKSNEDVEAILNNNFNLFTLSESLKNEVNRFPPFTSMFGNYEAVAGAEVLLYQKIKKVPTKYPLIAITERSGIKTGVIAGEGLWKWRLTDFVDNARYDNVNELINKIVQLLTVKDDKRKFKVNLPKNLFKENENIVFDAQLFNDAYEMVNSNDVTLVIKDQHKKEYKYSFSKTNNYYTLDAGLFPDGNYEYTATTSLKGTPTTVSGKFAVQAIQLEPYDLTARHDVLKSISDKFNGKLFYPSNMTTLADEIMKNDKIKPVIFQTTHTKSLLHYKWLFFLLLSLLSIEWFLRRYYGSY
jgi:hypothetical protein